MAGTLRDGVALGALLTVLDGVGDAGVVGAGGAVEVIDGEARNDVAAASCWGRAEALGRDCVSGRALPGGRAPITKRAATLPPAASGSSTNHRRLVMRQH